MSRLLDDTSTGLGVASDLLGGIGSYIGDMKSASQEKAAGRRARVATKIKLAQQDRLAYRFQGEVHAQIGAQGWTEGGSAEQILRMNATNLALDHGILQAEGSDIIDAHFARAQAYKSAATGSLISGILGSAAKVITMGIF